MELFAVCFPCTSVEILQVLCNVPPVGRVTATRSHIISRNTCHPLEDSVLIVSQVNKSIRLCIRSSTMRHMQAERLTLIRSRELLNSALPKELHRQIIRRIFLIKSNKIPAFDNPHQKEKISAAGSGDSM
jgi:hypothetical protein